MDEKLNVFKFAAVISVNEIIIHKEHQFCV